MPTVRVKLDTSLYRKALAELKAGAPAAIARALNRAAASAKTAMKREVATDLGLKVSDVADRIGIVEAVAQPGRQAAQLTASPTRLPLILFGARGPEPSRGQGRGVTAKLPGGAGVYPHAFITTFASGHRGVFQRKGRARLPLWHELSGPSIVRVFGKHVAVGLARAEEQMAKNLQSEFKYLMRQVAK